MQCTSFENDMWNSCWRKIHWFIYIFHGQQNNDENPKFGSIFYMIKCRISRSPPLMTNSCIWPWSLWQESYKSVKHRNCRILADSEQNVIICHKFCRILKFFLGSCREAQKLLCSAEFDVVDCRIYHFFTWKFPRSAGIWPNGCDPIEGRRCMTDGWLNEW